MRSVACGRYIVKQKLGAGSFGEIHRGEDKETGQSVAIKFEPVKTHVPQLSYESKLYNIFKNGVNVPKFYWFGTESPHNSMVIELLGKSLEDLAAQFPHHRLSLKTVLMLADQMLSAVQYIHLMNFIHRDIKPDNFVMGIGKNSNKIFIIDYGLSKKYRDPHTHQHIKYTEHKDLTGTARYASLAALKGIEQSRRDDLEALGFVWLYLLRGDLPWMGLDAHNRRQKYDRICQVKEETSFEALCKGFPEEFVRYFYSVRSLRFVEEPDYSLFRKMFRKLFMKLGYIYDYNYDWTIAANKKNHHSHDIYNTLNNNSPHSKPKESQPKADFLSDREKRPKMISIPNQEKTKQKSKSRRGANDVQLDAVNPNLSTAPQLSLAKGGYAKDTNDQNRVKANIKKPKRLGKSEADAFPRIQVPAPKHNILDSSSSDDQIRLSQKASKRTMKSANNNNSNVNSTSKKAVVSKSPNRENMNGTKVDPRSPHPTAPVPGSSPNLVSAQKSKKNTPNAKKDDYSYSSDGAIKINADANNAKAQQPPKNDAKNNKKVNNDDDEYYYSSESYSYEDKIEKQIRNCMKKQSAEAGNTEGNNDSPKRNSKNSSTQNQKNQKSPVDVNGGSTKQKSKSPGRSDAPNSGTPNKRKSQNGKKYFGNYNTLDDTEAAALQKMQKPKRSETNTQDQNEANKNNESLEKTSNNSLNNKRQKKNNSSSSGHSNEMNELNSPRSAPIPTPKIPTMNTNDLSEQNVGKQETPTDQNQKRNKSEKPHTVNNINNDNNNSNSRSKLKRTTSNVIKQNNGVLESSSSSQGIPVPSSNQNHQKRKSPQAKRTPNSNEKNSYTSGNYYSDGNSSYDLELPKGKVSKTPQRPGGGLYATTSSTANPTSKQDIRSKPQQYVETPNRSHNNNSRYAYLARHHTDVVRDKRIPIAELSGSDTSSSYYDDNNNRNASKNRQKGTTTKHNHSSMNVLNDRRKERVDHKDRSTSYRNGGETDVGVIQQRMKIPRPDKDLRRGYDSKDRNDDDLNISENFNFSSSRTPGRRSDALFQSRSPNLRPAARPGSKKKLLSYKDRRNTLRPSAIIPNWMNEKFKGRK